VCADGPNVIQINNYAVLEAAIMSKHSHPEPVEDEALLEEDLEIDEGDYGFIFSADGELKHMFTPEDFYLDPPPVVKKILKALGIKDINSLSMDGNDTIH
jgi:hypothetical protein